MNFYNFVFGKKREKIVVRVGSRRIALRMRALTLPVEQRVERETECAAAIIIGTRTRSTNGACMI